MIRRCATCGRVAGKGEEQCPNCGNDLPPQPEPVAPPPPERLFEPDPEPEVAAADVPVASGEQPSVIWSDGSRHAVSAEGPALLSSPSPGSGASVQFNDLLAGRASITGSTSGKAVFTLVCGIAGLFFLPLLPSIAAVILGPQARSAIAASGGTLAGDGIAITGMVLGWLSILFWVGFVALIAIGLAVGS